MSLTRIDNQAVTLYTPEETTFNERGNDCKWHKDYYQVVTCDDVTEIILNTSDNGAGDIQLDPTEYTSGTATSTATNKLINSGGYFEGTVAVKPVTTEMIVVNKNTGNYAQVVSVDSAEQLTLSDDIFTSTDDYIVGNTAYVGLTYSSTEYTKTAGSTATLVTAPLGENGFYTVEFSVFSTNNSGTLSVYMGDNLVGIYTDEEIEATTYTLQGYSTNDVLRFEMSVGLEIELSTDISIVQYSGASFLVRECDTGNAVYSSFQTTDIVKSTNTNQIKISFDWGNLVDGYDCNCGCYYIEIDEINSGGTTTVYRTDCFQLCDTDDCTIKLSGTNNDNAFGIDFEGLLYTPFLRVQGELRTARYSGDLEDEEDSRGNLSTIYLKSNKVQTLHLYMLPEHLHDFIRLLKHYDEFYINDVKYLAIDVDYEPEWMIEKNKEFDLANVNFDVRKSLENNKNRYC